MLTPEAPLALLAELTHRCPLRCPYCSNPAELTRAGAELATAEWARVFREAAALGCLQIHLSGGEPTARRDIVEIVAAAREAGLYTNLITAGVLLDAALMGRLAEAGLDHVQLSVQDAEEAGAEGIGGLKGEQGKKPQKEKKPECNVKKSKKGVPIVVCGILALIILLIPLLLILGVGFVVNRIKYGKYIKENS